MKEKTNERLKALKQSFRLMMNGPASQSMREKGLGYHLNWGVPLPMLKQKAKEIGQDYDLAIALWKEDIRECKILATLVMPVERMDAELAKLWMDQCPTQEMAELLALNLFRHLDCAADLAYEWIASDRELNEICGYSILSRLFMQGQTPDERAINELLDQIHVALYSTQAGVAHAAMNAAVRFAALGDIYNRIAAKALPELEL